MKNNSTKKIIALGASAFVLIVVILSIVFYFINNSKSESSYNPEVSTVIDPGTGEVIVDVTSKSPEVNGRSSEAVISGSQELLNMGVQYSQLEKIWSFYQDFARNSDPDIKYISFDLDTLKTTSIDQKTGAVTIDYKIFIERDENRVLKSKISYTTTNDVKLVISDTKNKILYKSY